MVTHGGRGSMKEGSWAPIIAQVQRMEKALLDISKWCYEFEQDKNKSNERLKKFIHGIQHLARDGLGENPYVAGEDRKETP
jgi:hypothetical protein